MTFVLSKAYRWPVPVEMGDDGEFPELTLDLMFKRLSTERVRQILQPQEGEEISDETLCKEVVVGWFDVKDDEGNDIEFNKKNLENLLAIHPVPAKIVNGWMASIFKETKEKN